MLLQVGFIYFASVIVACGLMVITRKNPVHSVLFMLPLFFHVAGIFIMLDAEFVAAIQILVYAGAIMVLFLFVVMLFKLHSVKEKQHFQTGWPVLAAFVLTLGGFLMSVLVRAQYRGVQGAYTIDRVKEAGNSQVVGKLLFTEFAFPFEVASVILLVAMVGAIALASKKAE